MNRHLEMLWKEWSKENSYITLPPYEVIEDILSLISCKVGERWYFGTWIKCEAESGHLWLFRLRYTIHPSLRQEINYLNIYISDDDLILYDWNVKGWFTSKFGEYKEC